MWKDDISKNTINTAFKRRSDTCKDQDKNYFSSLDKHNDQVNEKAVIQLCSGECYTSANAGELVVTVLGSCIACCVHDPVTKSGGMNHFLLPGDKSSDSARFGVNAMELLLNGMYKLKASKSSLIVKIFGGANLINNMAKIGDKNIAFIRDFLRKEGLKIVAEDVGGDTPRKVHFEINTGKVMLRRLKQVEDLRIIEKERAYLESFRKKAAEVEDNITLFGDD